MNKLNFKQKYTYLLYLCSDSYDKGLITFSQKTLIKSK